jgi:molecular chaperone GrpE
MQDEEKLNQNNIENQDVLENEEELVELDESGEELSQKDKLKKLKESLKEEQKKSKEYLDGWQRARADLVNKEKQLQVEKIEIYKQANSGLLEDLIPALDSYEMARKNETVWESVDKNWRLGIEYIFSNLSSTLESYGLKKIEVKIGDSFDVNKMQAVEEITIDDISKDHTVAEIIQSGYILNDKILREVKVKVFVKK